MTRRTPQVGVSCENEGMGAEDYVRPEHIFCSILKGFICL